VHSRKCDIDLAMKQLEVAVRPGSLSSGVITLHEGLIVVVLRLARVIVVASASAAASATPRLPKRFFWFSSLSFLSSKQSSVLWEFMLWKT
jgi:C4-type Zn-finger protein